MTIDWQAFTPWTSLLGGMLIGLAAAAFILLNGRIAGISGILGGLLTPRKADIGWRVAFVAGMIAAPLIWLMLSSRPAIQIDASYPILIVAGLVVGVSTRFGAGCTSGHGVCGISRLSPRSLIATAAFMLSGFVTVFVVRHLLGGL
ncbi:YeeE/YedE family protein [Porticoccus sp.]|uniref:YeeE/YedE family protein n=1 Tax=Porticoccus sp. TaxID=2024853 RepID=UPI003F69C874